MPTIRYLRLVAGFLPLLYLSAAHGEARTQAPVDAATPAFVGPEPELFAPGVISGPANDGSPTFAPDGNTLYFTRSTAGWGVILESHKANGAWSTPEVAPFSGEWPDSSPGMAPDGSYLVFVSTRPKSAAASGEKSVGRSANLYRVNRVGADWSQPERLPDTVNIGPSIWKPSVGSDGTIYFVVIDAQGGKRLYSSPLKNGAYQRAQPLSFSDGTTADVDPEIAPDGSFLLFCSSGRTKDAKDHLYITLKNGAEWGPVSPLHYAGDGASTDDEPHLGPDRKSIYFSSDRAAAVSFPRTHEQAVQDFKRLEVWDNSNSNVWFMSLAPWLKTAK